MKMDYFNEFLKELKYAVAVLRLRGEAAGYIYGNKAATKWAIFILVFAPVVNLILSSLLFPSGFSSIFSRFLFWPVVIRATVMAGVFFAISVAAERLFKKGYEVGHDDGGHTGRGVDHIGFFRVLAYSSLIFWITILPAILDLLGLALGNGFFNLLWLISFVWVMTVAYNFLVKGRGLRPQDAGICIAIGVVAYFVFHLILGKILVGSYYRIF